MNFVIREKKNGGGVDVKKRERLSFNGESWDAYGNGLKVQS